MLPSQIRFYPRRVVLADQPAPLTPTNVEDPKRLLRDGTLRLGETLAVGDYVLQVIVTDKLADEKSNTAAQCIDFSVHR